MLDPFTVPALSAMLGGVFGNRTDAAYCRALGALRDRLGRLTLPENQDIAKAVRSSALEALRALAEARLEELGVEPGLFARDVADVVNPDRRVRWSLAVVAWTRSERALSDLSAMTIDRDQLLALLAPAGGASSQKLSELEELLVAKLTEALRSADTVGYVDREVVRKLRPDDGKPGWFAHFCGFFEEEIKTNERVSAIVEAKLLTELVLDNEERVTMPLFQSGLAELSRSVRREIVTDGNLTRRQLADATDNLRSTIASEGEATRAEVRAVVTEAMATPDRPFEPRRFLYEDPKESVAFERWFLRIMASAARAGTPFLTMTSYPPFFSRSPELQRARHQRKYEQRLTEPEVLRAVLRRYPLWQRILQRSEVRVIVSKRTHEDYFRRCFDGVNDLSAVGHEQLHRYVRIVRDTERLFMAVLDDDVTETFFCGPAGVLKYFNRDPVLTRSSTRSKGELYKSPQRIDEARADFDAAWSRIPPVLKRRDRIVEWLESLDRWHS